MPQGQNAHSKHDRETWSPELDWYLNCRDAACGVQSSFASQVAAIERGGGGGGGTLGEDGSYVHPYNDQQVSNVKFGARAFAMDRRMRVRWAALDVESKAILYVHYTGAFPSGGKGQGGRQRWPKGVESRLGELAGVALFLALREGKLEKVLKSCEKGDDKALGCEKGKPLSGATARALAAVKRAHLAYYALTDQDAARWAEDRPAVPGLATVAPATEPWWADRGEPPNLWALVHPEARLSEAEQVAS